MNKKIFKTIAKTILVITMAAMLAGCGMVQGIFAQGGPKIDDLKPRRSAGQKAITSATPTAEQSSGSKPKTTEVVTSERSLFELSDENDEEKLAKLQDIFTQITLKGKSITLPFRMKDLGEGYKLEEGNNYLYNATDEHREYEAKLGYEYCVYEIFFLDKKLCEAYVYGNEVLNNGEDLVFKVYESRLSFKEGNLKIKNVGNESNMEQVLSAFGNPFDFYGEYQYKSTIWCDFVYALNKDGYDLPRLGIHFVKEDGGKYKVENIGVAYFPKELRNK